MELAPQSPIEVLRCLENLIRAPKERWFIDMHRARIREIVEAGHDSPDARSPARALAQRLLTMGLLEFEPLAR